MYYKDYLTVAKFIEENVAEDDMLDTDQIADDLYIGSRMDNDLKDALLHIGIESVTNWYKTDIKKSIGRIASETLLKATVNAEMDFGLSHHTLINSRYQPAKKKNESEDN